MIQCIYGWDGHSLVTQLNQQECTSDPVLDQVFLDMETYLSDAQSIKRKVFLYLFGLIVIIFNIGGLLNMKNRMEKLGFEAKATKILANDKDQKKMENKQSIMNKSDPKTI